MDKRKHKRPDDGIMKPSDLKKSRVIRGAIPSSSNTSVPGSSGITSGLKAKLDFRSLNGPSLTNKQLPVSSSSPGNIGMRPNLDDKWKEFGDTINMMPDSFHKSMIEAVEQEKYIKVARLIVAALKYFTQNEKIKVELRVLGAIAEGIKRVGDKLNHIPVHKGLLYVISHSRQVPEKIFKLLVSIVTSLAKQQPILDSCYILAFLNDAVGSNIGIGTANKCCWIDKPCCEDLVRLILGPFATKYPTQDLYSACQIENFGPGDYLIKMKDSNVLTENEKMQMIGFVDIIKCWFDNIRGELIPKSLFRTLGLFCGCEQVRHFISTRLEIWITSQKFHREISELLLILGCNINAENELDSEVIEILLKLNAKIMKTRTISAPFNIAIKKICETPTNVAFIFEMLMMSEIGQIQNRSTSNFPTMFMLLSIQPFEATTTLGICCASLLIKEREGCMKTLRGFLKELIRGFIHSRNGEFLFSVFASSFLERISIEGESETGIEAELPRLVCEFLAQVPLYTISALVLTKENAFSAKYSVPTTSNELPIIPTEVKVTREKFQQEYRLYCEVYLKWLAKEKMTFPDENIHLQCYYFLFYLEKHRELYSNVEGAAVNEADLPNCIRIFGECGISEKMIMLLFGDICCAIPNKNALEIATLITQRAALNHPKFHDCSILEIVKIDPFKLIDRTLQISVEMTRVPDLPLISSKTLYWVSWNLVLLWLTAGSKISSKFAVVYEAYPTLRYLVHVILLGKFEFPMNFEGKTSQELMSEDDSLLAKEALICSQYEKAIPLQPNSLISKSLVFIAKEQLRIPPSFDEIRHLSNRYRLASRLCLCQSPPLLRNLIENVGAKSALPAIKEMLTVDSSTVEHLSPECLFHAMVYYYDLTRKDKDEVNHNVFNALIRTAEMNIKSETGIEDDVLLRTIITSLSSSNLIERSASVLILSLIFPSTEKSPFHLKCLAKLPRFEANKSEYLKILSSVVQIESDSSISQMYLLFLAENFEKESMHQIAKNLCSTVSLDRFSLRNSLCEFFVNYIDSCIELCQFDGSLEDVENRGLKVVEIATTKILIDDQTPNSIIRLLSKYTGDDSTDTKPFENLIELWLSPGAIPKVVNLTTGQTEKFLSLPMRKEMLRSNDQRVVEAALDEMSESDAQSFVLVSQMSNETADKVLSKAENMNLSEMDLATLANMHIIIRGYQIKGVKSGSQLLENVRSRLNALQSIVKDEPMIVETVENIDVKPEPFITQSNGDVFKFSLENMDMKSDEITAWLKTNCTAASKKQNAFNLPPAFVQSAIRDEISAMACLNIIETNLKFFLSNESAFHTLIVIVDTASHKFDAVQKRLETLAVRLLKSVNPPASVSGVLKKHAATSSKTTTFSSQSTSQKITKINGLAEWLRKNESSKRRKVVIDEFVTNFKEEETLKEEDAVLVIKSVFEMNCDGDIEAGVEKCISAPWTAKFKNTICRFLLDFYQESICPLFVYRLIESQCRTWPIASFRQFFLRTSDQKIVDNVAFKSFSLYLCNVASSSEDYDLNIVNLVTSIEKRGGIQTGLCIGHQLLQISCVGKNSKVRKAAERLLSLFVEMLPYLSYKPGVGGSIRLTSNIVSREICIRRCEQIVDRLIEIPNESTIFMADTVSEDPTTSNVSSSNSKEEDNSISMIGMKRSMSDTRGPLAKKGKWTANREENEINPENEAKWNTTTTSIQQFTSMLKQYPNIVKTKFPVLANFVSQLNSMNKKELKDNYRVQKIELVLNCVIQLSSHMKNEEFTSIDTALTNCFEFYEKHVEEGLLHVKEQAGFSELLLKACCAYLNKNSAEARIFLRDNRSIVDRICKRCRVAYDVDLINDNIPVVE